MAAKDPRQYQTNGAAAYDAYRQTLPQQLPEEVRSPARRPKVKVKAKTTIAPFALIGSVAVILLLAMVIHGYVQLYEVTSRVGDLNDQYTVVERENNKLRSAYESQIDLGLIEIKAKQLGMKQPSSSQTVYVNVSGVDRAEILQTPHQNLLVDTWNAIKESFTGILEYFF